MTGVFWLAKQGLAFWGIELEVPMEIFLSCSLSLIIGFIKKWGGAMEQKLGITEMAFTQIIKTMGTVLVENALLAKAL